MDLKKYLETYEVSKEKFAEKLNISKRSLYNYLSYTRMPPLDVARDIEIYTKEKVRIDDLLAYWRAKKKYG